MNETNYYPQTNENIVTSSEYHPSVRSRKKTNLLAVLIFFTGFVILSFTLFLGYAYGQIVIGDQTLQTKTALFVQGLPFMPKTPFYVLYKSIQSENSVIKGKFDASISLGIKNSPLIGTGNSLDLTVNGYYDYANLNSFISELNYKVSTKLDIDVKLDQKKIYFKINSMPDLMWLYLGLLGANSDKFLGKWFVYTEPRLNTEASHILEADSKNESIKSLESMLMDLNSPEFSPFLDLKNEQLNSKDVYHITFTPDNKTLKKIYAKMNKSASDSAESSVEFEDLTFDGWVNKKDYLLEKFALKFEVNSSALKGSSGAMLFDDYENINIPVVAVVNISEHGKEHKVEIPTDAVGIEEYVDILYKEATPSAERGIGDFMAKARNAERKSDVISIARAIDSYLVTNNSFPIALTSKPAAISSDNFDLCKIIVPNYLEGIPIDPQISIDKKTAKCDGSKYDSGYTIMKSAGKYVIAAPFAEDGEVVEYSF